MGKKTVAILFEKLRICQSNFTGFIIEFKKKELLLALESESNPPELNGQKNLCDFICEIVNFSVEFYGVYGGL